jgi:stringent starvation protein B
MLSNRPYLLRAFYQWILDSACTPILVIDVNHPRCKVPLDYAEGGEIVFNISPSAVRDLKLGNELVEFKASFSGVIHVISAPIKAILAVYAEENGEGIFFDAEDDSDMDSETEGDANVPHLKRVDDGISDLVTETSEQLLGSGDAATTIRSKPFLKLVE